MSDHAVLSPSSASRWIRCAGSVAMESVFPNSTNASAEFGTAGHEVGEKTLTDDEGVCLRYVGETTKNGVKVTKAMAEMVQAYVDKIKEYADGNHLLVEQRVDFSSYVGVVNSFGTSDAIIIAEEEKELQTHDLKTGYHIVEAEENEQLMLYALGAYDTYGSLYDFDKVRLAIHQPSREHFSEWICSVSDLLKFADVARVAAQEAMRLLKKYPDGNVPIEFLKPGEKQCKYCKAFANCPAASKAITDIVGMEFEDLTLIEPKLLVPALDSATLATKMDAVGLIEDFCKYVRAEVERRMLAGEAVPGYKLVQGKKGNRAWISEDDAETLLKGFRLKTEVLYKMKLISPTAAEELLAKANPKRWNKVKKLITQSDGAISVAPEGDKRPAITRQPIADHFDDETGNDLV